MGKMRLKDDAKEIARVRKFISDYHFSPSLSLLIFLFIPEQTLEGLIVRIWNLYRVVERISRRESISRGENRSIRYTLARSAPIKFGNLSGGEVDGHYTGKGLVCRLEKREDEREWLSVFDCSDVEYRFETIVRDQRYDWISNTSNSIWIDSLDTCRIILSEERRNYNGGTWIYMYIFLLLTISSFQRNKIEDNLTLDKASLVTFGA